MSVSSEKIVNQLRDAWRSRWWGVAAAWLVCAVGWSVAFLLPNAYEARASVYVNTSSSLRPMLKGLAVQSDISSQLDLIRQVLLSRDTLLQVAQESQLYSASATQEEKDRAALDLRQRLHISSGPEGRDRLYSITYRDRNRDTALAVVGSLLQIFIERTVGSNRTMTDSAERFLMDQKADYERRLSEAENRLADFRRTHIGFVPGERLDYFSRLQAELDQKKLAERSLEQAREQRDQIKKQLSGESAVIATTGVGAMAQSAGQGGYGGTSIDRRIVEAEDKLGQIRMQWTDRHPEVIAQQKLLERLRAERRTYYDALGVSKGVDSAIAVESNPVYQSLRLSLNQVELRIAESTSEVKLHAKSIEDLERQANVVPRVEADYQKLSRDYSGMNAQYQEIVRSLETAKVSGEAAHKEAVDFRIIEPASAGSAPVTPKRLLLIPAIFVGALGMAVWVALLRSRMAPVVYASEDMVKIAPLPVLGIIGNTSPESLLTRKRRSIIGFAGSLACLLLGLGVVLWVELFAKATFYSSMGGK